MFDAEGDVCDSVYHLIDKSKDGSMVHQGMLSPKFCLSASHPRTIGDTDGTDADGDLESFHFNLTDADTNIHTIALVINVATDGEDLTDVMSCGIRFRALDSEPSDGVVMHVTTERVKGAACASSCYASDLTVLRRQRNSARFAATRRRRSVAICQHWRGCGRARARRRGVVEFHERSSTSPVLS